MTSGAIYISPLFCGTNNEKKMVRSPQEVDSGNELYHRKIRNELLTLGFVGNYAAYTENPSAQSPQV